MFASILQALENEMKLRRRKALRRRATSNELVELSTLAPFLGHSSTSVLAYYHCKEPARQGCSPNCSTKYEGSLVSERASPR